MFCLAFLSLCTIAYAGDRDKGSTGVPDIRKEAAALRGKWNQTLKSKIAGCDSVQVIAKWYSKDEQVVTTITDRTVVDELIGAIEVVEDSYGASNTGIGYYQYRFTARGAVVATISEMCGCLAWDDGSWVGTPRLTDRSSKALAQWITKYIRQ